MEFCGDYIDFFIINNAWIYLTRQANCNWKGFLYKKIFAKHNKQQHSDLRANYFVHIHVTLCHDSR